MMYSLMTMPDGTEIVYSDIRQNKQGENFVRVYIERWNELRRKFDSINIILPNGEIKTDGFSRDEQIFFIDGIKRMSNLIWELAEEQNAKLGTSVGV